MSADKPNSRNILVALIGAVALILSAVIGAGIENITGIIDLIRQPPPERVLIADFNDPENSFSPDTITQRECDNLRLENGAVHITNPGDAWHECRFTIRPKDDLYYEELGSVEATFQVDDTEEEIESSSYIEMITFFPGVELKAHCGMMQTRNKAFGFLSVKTVQVGDQPLTCPEDKLNEDGTICELWFDGFTPLDTEQDYTFELHANQKSFNEFQCFANGADSQVWVDSNSLQLASSLAESLFERYLIVGHVAGSTATYTFDDVYEIR